MNKAETLTLIEKLQTKIYQLELTNKGALNALEFRLDKIFRSRLCRTRPFSLSSPYVFILKRCLSNGEAPILVGQQLAIH